MAGKIFLGWPNRMSDAGLLLAGGSWLPALPLANLLNRTPTVVARSTDLQAASTKFSIELPLARTLKAFALQNHNLTRTATWRLYVGTAAGLADVFDSGQLPVWRLNFDTDLLEWESPAWWSGTYDDDFVGHPFAAIWIAPGWPSGRFIGVDIHDANNPDGYVQLGRLFVGGGISPAYNLSYGVADGWQESSQIEQAIGGSEYFDERRQPRMVRFQLDWVEYANEFRQHYELQRRLGTTGEILYVPDDADMARTQLTGFVGRLRQLSPIEYPFFHTRKVAFELKELL